MKIYTYYQDIGFDHQQELLDLWQESWRKQNFDPVILGIEDAKKCPIYQAYYDFVQRIHENALGKTLEEDNYCLAAQLEIAAFTTVDKDEPCYMSDYDVINRNFKDISSEGKLHWRNAACSCFASSSGYGWRKYLDFLLTQEDEITNWCVKETEKTNRTDYHDQDFLIAIQNKGLEENIYYMSRQDHLCEMYIPHSEGEFHRQLYHISHGNVQRFLDCYKECAKILNVKSDNVDYEATEKIRLSLVKNILNMN